MVVSTDSLTQFDVLPDTFQPQKIVSNNRQVEKKDSSVGFAQTHFFGEYYSSKSIDISYTSKDGDSVILNAQSIEYGKFNIQAAVENREKDIEKFIKYIQNNIEKMQKHFMRSLHLNNDPSTTEVFEGEKSEEASIALPEYWNAENTSQRIVDFAVSFIDLFSGSDTEYLSMIRNAIDEGFKQAKELLGELPDQVQSLIDDTYALVTEKLDTWANEQGKNSKNEAAVSV